ncbi:hypothetical protein SAMN02910339_02699 [Lachnospiraceae bacterium YSD2013]|jgi:hypothetical protein|nr:hypothetical protein SAMN02910339_02699 [Lachnospiraceae bacterium YSD2013]
MKLKIKELFERIRKALKPYQKNIIQPLLKIILIIVICMIIVHVISGHETLSQYADKNPDIAYSTSVSGEEAEP